MSYATLTELLERIPEGVLIDLTDDDAAGVVDTDKVDRAIGDADTEIDSYLGRRYPLPIEPAPPLLVRLSLDLATEVLYGRRAHVDTPEAVTRAARTARSILADIAVRKADLPGLADTTAGAGPSGASFSADGRLFTRSSQRGL